MFARVVEKLIKQKDDIILSHFVPLLEAELKRIESVGWGYGDMLGELLSQLKEAYPENRKAVT